MRVDISINVMVPPADPNGNAESRWIDACWDNLDILVNRLDYHVWENAKWIRIYHDCAKIADYPLHDVDLLHLQNPPDDLVGWLNLYYPQLSILKTNRAAGYRMVLRDGT